MFGKSWKDRVENFIDDSVSERPQPRRENTELPYRVMHVDMDAFFAALEELKNPCLAGKPLVVGGSPDGRGVVSTASYPTRKYGVHSGMSAKEALRLCPQATFVGSELRQYTYVSAELINIFYRFSPTVEATSVDEAFLDVTGCGHLYGSEQNLGLALKREIRDRLSLTCSVGIAPTKVMAKVASSVFKPDGLMVLDREGIEQIIHPLPVGKLWGVGPSTLKVLEEIGIHTIGDLAHHPLDRLRQRFGKCGDALGRIARGEEDSTVLSERELPLDKSMGHETTLPFDVHDRDYQKATLHHLVHDRDYQKATLHHLCDRVARRMRRHDFEGRTITLKLRWNDFKTITRAITISTYTDDTLHLYRIVLGLWQAAIHERNRKVRLLGVSVSHLRKKDDNPQLGLFNTAVGRKKKNTDAALDQLRNKFGESVIQRAYSHLGND